MNKYVPRNKEQCHNDVCYCQVQNQVVQRNPVKTVDNQTFKSKTEQIVGHAGVALNLSMEARHFVFFRESEAWYTLSCKSVFGTYHWVTIKGR